MSLGRTHLDRIDDWPPGLLFEILGPAVPELRRVEDRVQNRRRVAAAMLPAVADRGGLGIGTAKPEIVAGVAADYVARRQPWVEVQHRAKQDLRRCRRVARQLWRRRGDRLESLSRLRHQIVLR